MTITRELVRDACTRIAPLHKFEPALIFAVCLQEGQQRNGQFDPSVARLEQGYYRRYVEKQELASTSEVLLSASWGVMQMMGLSLKELGYFEWYLGQSPAKALLQSPLSQFAIVSALDAYCTNLDWMIEWGCRLMERKRTQAGGNTVKMLLNWNGGGNPKYAEEVQSKISLY